ncbi:PAS domain-containing sensor histidine kinase [Effusibacillus lacus]|uniref:histidine kinase n=2 Tax=Effusibacillus lacus TaxID=1348429 RepID=A0A292YLA0_9BACL|nr:PAS domain-containing sensor histidine kinase [Effusibacillus lacus]
MIEWNLYIFIWVGVMGATINDRIVGTAIVGIIAVDQAGRITFINQRAISILSNCPLTPEELMGRVYWNVFHKGIKITKDGKYTSCLIKTLETGKACNHREVFYRNKTLLVDSSPLLDEQGQSIGAIAIFKDITEQRMLEEQLRQAEKFAAVGQVSAGLAHELLNPLTVIKGFLQLSQQGVTLEADACGILLNEVNKVDKLVNDFLLLTNPSAPKYQWVSVPDLLHEMTDQFSSVAELNQITFELEIEPDLPEIRADLHQIRQVVINLVRNAFDCLSPGGFIRIRASLSQEHLVISVFNNGPVIPTEIRPKIFDPFFTTKDQGRGLGLAICYRIVENHSGQLHVESLEGHGTTFSVQLPLQINEKAARI